MSTNDNAVLTAIEILQSAMHSRFDSIEAKQLAHDDRDEKLFKELTTRVHNVELSLTNFKAISTAAGLVLAFFGWPGIREWLTSLTR